MSSTLNTLIEGVSEIQRGNFSTAIELLEEYCQNYKADSEDNYSEYIYAQQHIVKAYGYLGDKSKAIEHTKELAINGHPQIKKWAKRVLAYLSPEAYQSLPQEVIESDNQPLWDSQSAKLVLDSVNDYLEFGSNSHVVETLETACESLKFNTKKHLYAQVLLIEAYHLNGQLKNAIALCNQLLNSKHYVTRLLANQYLCSLSKNQEVRKRNLVKETELLTSTQALRRKQAIATIIVCNITAFSIILFFFKFPSFISLSLIVLFLIIYLLFYDSGYKAFTYKLEDNIIHKIYQFIDTNKNFNISTASSDKDNKQTLIDIQKSQILNGLIEPNCIKQSNLINASINNIDIKLANININSFNNYSWKNIFKRNRKQDVKSSVTVISIFAAMTLFAFRLFKIIPDVFHRMLRGKSIDFQRFQIETLKNQSYNTQVFKGLFFAAKSNQLSQSLTIIRPKLSETEINLLYYGEKKFTKLEDADFNSLFTVYSEDLVQANNILSTSLTEKLLRFRKKNNKNVYLSFVDDTIYIAIEYPEGIFEPNLFKSILKFAPLTKYFEAIQLILGIVEDLNK